MRKEKKVEGFGTNFGTKSSNVVNFYDPDAEKKGHEADSQEKKQEPSSCLPLKKKKSGKKTKFKYVSWAEHAKKWCGITQRDPITGKREKKYFDDDFEAHQWVNRRHLEFTQRRQRSRDLSEAERIEAAEGILKLEDKGIYSLGIIIKAVEEFIRRNPESTPKSVGKLFEDWIFYKTKTKRCRRKTINTCKTCLRKFVDEYGNKPVTTITREECYHYIYDASHPTTQRHRYSNLMDLFNFAQKEGRIGPDRDAHPLWNITKPIPADKDSDEENKVPWSIEDFEKLLRYAIRTEDEFHCTAYILLGAYAGVRNSELLKLRFCRQEIDIDSGIVRIKKTISKTRAKRTFEMHPDLQAALKILRDRPRAKPRKHGRELPRPTDDDSKVVVDTPTRLKGFRQKLHLSIDDGGAGLPFVTEGNKLHRDKLGVIRKTQPSAWIPNGLRTSFATYHDELTQDKNATARVMGHSANLNVFDNHYRMLCDPGDGKKFFDLIRKVFESEGYVF